MNFEEFIKKLNESYAINVLGVRFNEYAKEVDYFDYNYFEDDNQLWINDKRVYLEKINNEMIIIGVYEDYKDLCNAFDHCSNCYRLNDDEYQIYLYTNKFLYSECCFDSDKIQENLFDIIDELSELYKDSFIENSETDCTFECENETVFMHLVRDIEGYYYKVSCNKFSILSYLREKYNGRLKYDKGGKHILILR